jgi:hypothetical protein
MLDGTWGCLVRFFRRPEATIASGSPHAKKIRPHPKHHHPFPPITD